MVYPEVELLEEIIDKDYDSLVPESPIDQSIDNAWKDDVLSFGVENLCKARVNKQAEIAELEKEIMRITERIEDTKKKTERVEGYIQYLLEKDGGTKIKAGSFVVSMKKREKVSLEVGFNDQRYGQSIVVPDLELIKAALKRGTYIKDAKLITDYKLDIS